MDPREGSAAHGPREDDLLAGDAEETVVVDPAMPSRSDERVAELLEGDAAPAELAAAVEKQEPADAADVLSELSPGESVEVVMEMEDESAAEALAHMDHALAATVLADVGPEEAALLLQEMASDDAVDILQSAPREVASGILRALPAPTAARLGKLARYDPRSAGGLMALEFVRLPADISVAQAIERLRGDPVFTGDMPGTYVYVVDDAERLVGVLDIRRLLMVRPQDRIGEIMSREVDAIGPLMDRVDVAREFQRYDYISLPVVDEDRRLLGVVTIDDVVDIIQAEQTEDVLKQVGAGARESVHTGLAAKYRGRLPWLVLNLLTSQLAAATVLGFHDVLEQIIILSALMGVIANQAGNAGQQALAVTLRGLALGEVRPHRAWLVVAREVAVGLLSGLTVGVILLVAAALLGHFGLAEEMNWRIGLVGAVSMVAALSAGCLMGSGVPILIDRLGRDPATGSTIFLTMVTDSFSFLVFLGTATLVRGWLLPVAGAG